MFLPFQRLGDNDNHSGVGLGLALSRGLAEAMGGSLVPTTTPGGGLTMILALPAYEPTDTDLDDGGPQATRVADAAIVQRLRRWPRTTAEDNPVTDDAFPSAAEPS